MSTNTFTQSGHELYLWYVFGVSTTGTYDSWSQIESGGGLFASQWITVTSRAAVASGRIGSIDLSGQGSYSDPRDADRVTVDTSSTNLNRMSLDLEGVEYVDGTLSNASFLDLYNHDGFTTDGSINDIHANVGNHDIHYTTVIKDSSIFLGAGWDELMLEDHLDVPGEQYWAIIRRAENQVDAYSLLTGRRVRLDGGDVSRASDAGDVGNYGEIEQVNAKLYNASGTTNSNTDVVIEPGRDGALHTDSDGDRSLSDNIDLRSDGQLNTDSFNLAYFNFIRYTSDNLWVGEATVYETSSKFTAAQNHEIVDTKTQYDVTAPTLGGHLSVIGASRNGTHDMIVQQEAAGIDGQLRLYSYDMASGLYNEFNQVYIGDSGAESVSKSAQTSALSDRVALYGFGGNDTLIAGASKDYIFGGLSSYDQNIVGHTGNVVTGGAGADFFGVGNTDSTGAVLGADTVVGTATGSSGTGQFLKGAATDVITDWDAQTDTLEVLSNGVAVIGGLYGKTDLSAADEIDLRSHAAVAISDQDADGPRGGSSVTYDDTGSLAQVYGDQANRDAQSIANEANDETVKNDTGGLIVARGLDGDDTLRGSEGDDYLYGNAGANFIDLDSVGAGTDRVYYDTFDGSRARHTVADFDSNGSGTATDLFYVNKRVVDMLQTAFGGGAATRGIEEVQNVTGSYSSAIAYNPSINFLHDRYYSPNVYASTDDHRGQDGAGGIWRDNSGTDQTSSFGGADGTTFSIGAGMVAAGTALLFVPFMAGVGAALIGTGAVLGATGTAYQTVEHENAKFTGDVSDYVNVFRTGSLSGVDTPNTIAATSSAQNKDSLRFFKFFTGEDADDGFVPVIEFTGHTGGIFSYFAMHSDEETFVYLVSSADNLVENSEAMLVAEINGLLEAEDFKVYDGEADIYNQGTEAAITIVTPSIVEVRSTETTVDYGLDVGGVSGNNDAVIVKNFNNTDTLSTGVTMSGSLNNASTITIWDGADVIYTGSISGSSLVDISSATGVSASLSGTGASTTVTLTDARAIGTTGIQTDTVDSVGTLDDLANDNEFVISDSVVNYSVLVTDGETGLPTRDNSGAIRVSGGDNTIDGGGNTDTLMVTGTNEWLNGTGDANLVNIEIISLSPPEDSATFAGDADGFPTSTVTGSVTYTDGVLLDLSNQTDGFTVVGTQNDDTITGSDGATAHDFFLVSGGDNLINGLGGDDNFSYVIDSAGGVWASDTLDGGSGTDVLTVIAETTESSLSIGDVLFDHTSSVEILDVSGSSDPTTVVLASNAEGAGIDTVLGADSATDYIDASAYTTSITISGNGGNDTLHGGNAVDYLDGGAGDDVFLIDQGSDHASSESIQGDGGLDTIRFIATSTDTLTLSGNVTDTDNLIYVEASNAAGVNTGTVGLSIDANALGSGLDAHITGNDGSNTLTGNDDANNTITGLAGNDTIVGGTQDDSLIGGDGADTIFAGSGNDTVDGGSGADTITAGAGDESILAGDGNDLLRFEIDDVTSADVVGGETGTDTLALTTNGTLADADLTNFSSIENLTLDAGANTITLSTEAQGAGIVSVVGNTGGDSINASTYTTAIEIDATSGDNYVRSGSGNDTITATTGADTILSGSGDDYLSATGGNNSVDAGAGNDTVSTGSGSDTITAGAGTDSISSGDGNDLLQFEIADLTSADIVDGETGTDTLSLITSGTLVDDVLASVSSVEYLKLAAGGNYVELANDAQAAGILSVLGNTGGDTIDASAYTTGIIIDGQGGTDHILTGSAADTITGGAGSDTIWAGQGNDVVNANDGEVDHVIMVGDLSGADATKLGTVNTTLDALMGGSYPDVGTGYNTDVTAGETLNFNSTGAADILYTFGTVDLSNLTITGNFSIVAHSSLTLREDQFNQIESIEFRGPSEHSIIVKDSVGGSLADSDQTTYFEDWADASGTQLFVSSGATDVYVGVFANGGNKYAMVTPFVKDNSFRLLVQEDVEAILRGGSAVPPGSPFQTSAAINMRWDDASNGTIAGFETSGDDQFTQAGWSRSNYADVNDRFAGLQFVTYFEPGTTQLPIPKTFGSYGDNAVHREQFEVYRGDYDFRTGVFTIQDMPGGTNYSPSTQYTLVLYDDDPSVSVGDVEGIVFINQMEERDGWRVLNRGTDNALLEFNNTSLQSAIKGTAGNNTMNGASVGGADYLYGYGGDDDIQAGAGDFVIAGAGADTVRNSQGENVIDLGHNITTWANGDGDADVVVIAGGDSSAVGTQGQDFIYNFEFARDTLLIEQSYQGGPAVSFNHAIHVSLGGSYSSDTLVVDLDGNTTVSGDDIVVTLKDTDNDSASYATVVGRIAYDITGSYNDDSIVTGDLDDTVVTESGNDTIDAGSGSDSIVAGAGEDKIIFSVSELSSADYVDGGSGNDTLAFSDGGTIADVVFTNVSGAEIISLSGNSDVTLGSLAQAAGVSTVEGGEQDVIDASAYTMGLTVNAGANDDSIVTGSGDDVVDGGASNDTIRSGSGSDHLMGGDNNDVFVFSVSELTSGDTIDGGTGTDRLLLSSGGVLADSVFDNAFLLEQLQLSNGGNEVTLATHADAAGISTVIGGNGGDTVDASAYADSIEITGGAGSNHFTGGAGADVITTGAGTDTIISGAGNDSIVATSGSNNVDAGAGNDTVSTGAGADTIVAGDGNDVIVTTSGNNTVDAGAGNDSVTTGSGADTITAGAGDESILAGDGNDLLRFEINDVTSADVVGGGTGTDTLALTTNGTLADADLTNFSSIENLTLDADANTITLSTEAQGAGIVSVVGNTGGDSINASTYTVAIEIDAASGDNYVLSGDGNDTVTATTGADTIVSGAGNDTIIAGDGANSIDAGAGNDTVTAGSDNDTIAGGTGNDLIIVTGGNNTVDAGDGDDSVSTGSGNDTVTGGGGSDTIDAGSGNDTIYADATDIVDGGHDMDTVVFLSAVSSADFTDTDLVNVETVSVAGTLAFDFSDQTEALFITGDADASTIIGGSGNDSIVGAGGADSLVGGLGDDTLKFEAGDTLEGGAGDDVYVFDTDYTHNNTTPPVIIEQAGGGTDRLYLDNTILAVSLRGSIAASNFDEIEEIEVVGLSSSAFDGRQLTGETMTLYGIDGQVNSLTVFVDENTTDLSNFSASANWVAGEDYISILGRNSDADTIIGSSADDRIEGGFDAASHDLIDGGAGNDIIYGGTAANLGFSNDTIDGGSGDDRLVGGGGNDSLVGGAGADTIDGGTGADMLTGGTGDDSILGGDDADTIFGGDGVDRLTGGSGADVFVHNGSSGQDYITDFVSGTDEYVTDFLSVSLTGGTALTSTTVTGNGSVELNISTEDKLLTYTIDFADGRTVGTGAVGISVSDPTDVNQIMTAVEGNLALAAGVTGDGSAVNGDFIGFTGGEDRLLLVIDNNSTSSDASDDVGYLLKLSNNEGNVNTLLSTTGNEVELMAVFEAGGIPQASDITTNTTFTL